MCCGYLGLGRPNASAQAAIVSPKGAIAARHRGGGLQKSLPGAVVAREGVGAYYFSTGDFVVGRHLRQPGAEMLNSGELAHVGADLGDDLLRQVQTEAIHGGNVHLGDPLEVFTHVDIFGRIVAVRFEFVRRQGRLVVWVWVGPIGSDGGVGAFDLGIAGFDLLGVEVVHFQGLLEDEEVLLPPCLP